MRRRAWIAPLLGAAAIAAAAVFTLIDGASSARAAAEAQRHRPIEVASDGYVSSRACRACHPQQYRSWHASYHRTMTQPARPDSVLGPFDGRRLARGDSSYVLSRRGDQLWVRTEEPDGARDHKLALVTGSHHLQIYWYETGQQRELAPLAFAYLRKEARFIPREAAFLRPPGPGRSTEVGRWNTSCITCHTTHGVPGLGAEGELDTHVAEFGIGCEACHGPARQHVLANSTPWRRYLRHLSAGADATIVDPKDLDHREVSEMCGQCHGVWQFRSQDDHKRWTTSGFAYRPGADANATQVLFQPSLSRHEPLVATILQQVPGYAAGMFWSDGMERVSGREFNALFESPCYQRGEISCLSCHAMHQPAHEARSAADWADDQLALGMDGNRACLSCHEQYAERGALAAHTRHAPESSGSECYNCHMPYTTYGLLKAIRSHQVSSPDVGASVSTGRPNACNLCHLDRTLAWAADQLQRRYDIAPPELDAQQREVAASVLWSLRGDAGQRALLAWAFGWEPARRASAGDFAVPILGALLDDPYDAVRYIAERSLRRYPGFERFEYDFVPAPGSRQPVTARVLAAWSARRQGGSARPELLLHASGFDAARADELLHARDQRAVHLLE